MTSLLIALLVASEPDAGITTAPERVARLPCQTGRASFHVELRRSSDDDWLHDVRVSAVGKPELLVRLGEQSFKLTSGLPNGPCRDVASVLLPKGEVAVILLADGGPNADHLSAFVYDPATHSIAAAKPDLGAYREALAGSPDGFSFTSGDFGQCGGAGADIEGRGDSLSMCSAFLKVTFNVRWRRGQLVREYDRDRTYAGVSTGWFSSKAAFEKFFRYDSSRGELGRVWYQHWNTMDGSGCIAAIVNDVDPIAPSDALCVRPAPKSAP